MNQKGFKVGGSVYIDQLAYTYQTNSNKLSQVNDTANDVNSKLGDFHYTGTKGFLRLHLRWKWKSHHG